MILFYQNLVSQLQRQKNKQTTVEYILEEIKMPILLAILYYCFQSKAFKKMLLSKLPSLFNDTGTYSTNGYLAVSLMFSSLFYTINRLGKQLDF